MPKNISEISSDDVSKFAVFRLSKSGRSARFTLIRDTIEDAEAEAIRLLAECVAKYPDTESIFYVLELKVAFGFDGKNLYKVEK